MFVFIAGANRLCCLSWIIGLDVEYLLVQCAVVDYVLFSAMLRLAQRWAAAVADHYLYSFIPWYCMSALQGTVDGGVRSWIGWGRLQYSIITGYYGCVLRVTVNVEVVNGLG